MQPFCPNEPDQVEVSGHRVGGVLVQCCKSHILAFSSEGSDGTRITLLSLRASTDAASRSALAHLAVFYVAPSQKTTSCCGCNSTDLEVHLRETALNSFYLLLRPGVVFLYMEKHAGQNALQLDLPKIDENRSAPRVFIR